MAPPRIRVMISSRCNDGFPSAAGETTLSAIRLELKQELEAVHLLDNSQLFEVWINEDAPPVEGSSDSWDTCLDQIRQADVVLVLYNGNSGWAKQGGDVGICHAELMTALSTAAAKVRLVELSPLQPIGGGATQARNQRFRDYVAAQSLFRGAVANRADQVKQRCRESLREAVPDMVHLGLREARKGKFHTGAALEWNRLDFVQRKQAMEQSLTLALEERDGSQVEGGHVFVQIGGRSVLALCHGIPAAMTVAAARELVGQPFLRDHAIVEALTTQRIGPLHVIACHRGITEAQAIRVLGYPHATVVSAPFGVYVADDIHKIQLLFIANCRDDTAVRHGVQRFFDWLDQSGEGSLLRGRATSRKRIIRSIANELAQ